MICIDLEASGLARDSYPIEVAWKCSETGKFDSFLIDPSSVPGWTYWDEFASELHCIRRSMLKQEGISVTAAAERLNTALSGCEVLSDAPEYDGFWLKRLFDAADDCPLFELKGLETVLSSEERVQYQLISRAQFRRHRALPDVEHLLDAIQAAQSGATPFGAPG